MSLIRYNPFTSKLHPLNGFFDGSISNFLGSDFVHNQPSVNLIETEKEFRIELAAPGLEKKDFNINIEKDNLKIQVKKESDTVTENEKFTRREFNYSSFERSFNLGENVNTANITATYDNGVLNVVIPKREIDETPAKRNIEIS